MWVNYCFHKDSLKLFMQSLLFRSYIDILFAQFDRPLSQTSLTSKFKKEEEEVDSCIKFTGTNHNVQKHSVE